MKKLKKLRRKKELPSIKKPIIKKTKVVQKKTKNKPVKKKIKREPRPANMNTETILEGLRNGLLFINARTYQVFSYVCLDYIQVDKDLLHEIKRAGLIVNQEMSGYARLTIPSKVKK